MQLTHKIALCPTPEQAAYFRQAAGCARFVWNWALEQWQRQYAAGSSPNAMALKKSFNAIKYQQYPWITNIHRDAHAQPFTHLAKALARFFADVQAGVKAHAPQFKRKGKCRDSFYVANDKFSLDGQTIRLPKIGIVAMTEALRFPGKVLGATVSRTADRWFVAIQVDVSDEVAHCPRTGHSIEGMDLGLKAAATLASGEAIAAPKPLKAALRRLKIRSRRLARKLEAVKAQLNLAGQRMPKGTRLPVSHNRQKSAAKLARLHTRIANLRADFCHKLTTRLVRENQAIGIEDLHVKGMLANEKLARAISDVGFGIIRQQLEYKAYRYGTQIVVANRWYPSSKTCSMCGYVLEALPLSVRAWECPECNAHHDRDMNAARNLQRLATVTALPVASRTATDGAGLEMVPSQPGKSRLSDTRAVTKRTRGRNRIVRTLAHILDSSSVTLAKYSDTSVTYDHTDSVAGRESYARSTAGDKSS